MTQKDKRYLQDKLHHERDKELLLKDICARLPYNPMVEYKKETYNVLGIAHGRLVLCKPFMSNTLGECPLVEEVKPYLLPMSSMTEEQKKELADILIEMQLKAISDVINGEDVAAYEIDFYNRHHIDYRGLIPKGIAIDATGLGIY